jgi:hypothetical protein
MHTANVAFLDALFSFGDETTLAYFQLALLRALFSSAAFQIKASVPTVLNRQGDVYKLA